MSLPVKTKQFSSVGYKFGPLNMSYLKNASILPTNPYDKFLCIADQSKIYPLSLLLPYPPSEKSGERLKHALKEYTLLLSALEDSLHALEKKEYAQFDPLVGENACQIRALKNALIFSKYPIEPKHLLKETQLSKLKIVRAWSNIEELISRQISLQDFLQTEKIEIYLNYNELFLLQSFLLTKVKTLKPPHQETPFIKNEATDPKKIKQMGSVGTMFAEALVKKLRQVVSAASVKFVQELSKFIPFAEPLHKYFSKRFLVLNRRLASFPCYWTTKVLLLEALRSSIPLVMITRLMTKEKGHEVLKEVRHFYKATPGGYRKAALQKEDLQKPALVLLGSSYRSKLKEDELINWEKELTGHCPTELVLSYAAAHRQYPDVSKSHLVDQEECKYYTFHKKRAEQLGCSIHNPSFFFLSHAFCDQVKNVLKDNPPQS